MKRLLVHLCSPVLLVTLILGLSACTLGGGKGGTITQRVPTATPTPARILLGPQPCPASVQTRASWNALVHVSATQTVESILCGYLIGKPTLQAVVTVRSTAQDRSLDVYVFPTMTSPSPSPIFSLTGVPLGEATISNYNTLLINQDAQTPHPLAREFKWSDNAHTLVQVGFVGLYPDLTRYQAEVAQKQVNTGQPGRGWQLDAGMTAQSFVVTVLLWPENAPTTVIRGGGAHDAQAVVQVTNPAAGNASIQVSLSRLELNTNGGIWEVTDVATTGMALTTPHSLQQIASPAQVSGSAAPVAGAHMVLTVLNTERTILAQKTLALHAGNFTTSLSSTSLLSQGEIQEGIIALYLINGSQQIVGCVMVKVLFQT